MSRDVDTVAGALFEQCVRPGNFVIIYLQNSPEFIISWFACAQLGAIAVSTNTRSMASDINYFADHVSTVGAVTQPAFAELVHESAPNPEFLAFTDNGAGQPARIPDLPHVPSVDFLNTTACAPK